jgi:hypothetical protein
MAGDAGLGELRQLLAGWQAELDGRNLRLPIFLAKQDVDDGVAYHLEYARITVLDRCIGTLADVLHIDRGTIVATALNASEPAPVQAAGGES